MDSPDDLLLSLIEERLDLNALSPLEWEVVSSCLEEMRKEGVGESSLMEAIYHADYHRKPPTWNEFVTDPEYLGDVCVPLVEENRIGLFPFWQRFMGEAMSPSTFPVVNQLILSGSIGGGKCVAKGTKITMADGSMKLIENVVVGDEVMTEAGTGRVNAVFDEGVMKTASIKTNIGNLLHGSWDRHRVRVINFSTKRYEWRLMRDLKRDDCLVGKTTTGRTTFQTVARKVKEDSHHCFDISVDGDSPTYISNGVVSHNTFTGVLALLYKMCRCLCLRNPLLYYGIAPTSRIIFNLFSVTQAQVKGGAFADAVASLAQSPFFRENIRDNVANRKFADRRVELSRGLFMEAGSKVHEALGRNVLGSLIDEINFRLEKDAAVAASELISAIDRRYASRFGHSDDGLLVIVSSARSESDFLSSHIRAQSKNPRVRIANSPWWDVAGDVKPPGGVPYSGVRFKVDVGDSLHAPRIIDTEEELQHVPPNRVLPVPVEHRASFDADLIGAIRDLGGVTTGRQSKFFYNHMVLINSFTDEVTNPFRKDTLQLSVDQPHSIIDLIEQDRLIQIVNNRSIPRRHPTAPRFIHIDISTGAMDAMGIAMVHPVHMVEVNRINLAEQREETKAAPVFELDFALRLVRGPSHEPIDIGKVRTFISRLRKYLNFQIQAVSCDLLTLSHETRLILKQMGFDTYYKSMDRTREGYDVFRQVVTEQRWRMSAENHYLISEFINLEDGGDFIDHPAVPSVPWKYFDENNMLREFLPTKGSKDVADAVAGAVWLGESHEASYKLAFSDTVGDRLIAMAAKRQQVEASGPMSFPVADEAKPDRIMNF
jgi:hypothetical protein